MKLRVARKVLYQWQRWFTVAPRAARGTKRYRRLAARMRRKMRKHRARRWLRGSTSERARRRWLRALSLFRRLPREQREAIWVTASGRIEPFV